MTVETKGEDTFTEAIDTDIQTHLADTGEAWDATVDQFFCDAMRGVLEMRSRSNGGRLTVQDTRGTQFKIGDELSCDLYRATGHSGGGNRIGFLCQCEDLGVASVDFYKFSFDFTGGDDAQVYCYRQYSGGNQNATLITVVVIPQDSWIKLGVTIVSAHEYDVWWEPLGGGTRFVIGTWSPAVDANYDFLKSVDHLWMGVIVENTVSTTGPYPAFDNLTHDALVGVDAPTLSNALTYQRVLNVTRMRSGDFGGLVIDDMQIIDELNAITLELMQEGTDADVSSFQQIFNWATHVAPLLTPVPADLREVDNILVPGWVQTVFAIEGIRSNGSKIEIGIQRKESEVRDRIPDHDEGFGFYAALLDSSLRKPRAWRVWDGDNSVWRLYKDLTSEGGKQTWEDIVDVNLVVSGVPLAMTKRPDLNDTIPLPFRALRPLAEAYAIILGGRTNKSVGWMRDQRLVKQKAFDDFREFINQSDMSRDEPFDPEIGLDW